MSPWNIYQQNSNIDGNLGQDGDGDFIWLEYLVSFLFEDFPIIIIIVINLVYLVYEFQVIMINYINIFDK